MLLGLAIFASGFVCGVVFQAWLKKAPAYGVITAVENLEKDVVEAVKKV